MITEVKVLPPRPNLEQYKKQAKELLKSLRAGDAEAIRRVATYHPQYAKDTNATLAQADFSLTDAQWTLAREYGFESWPKFVVHLEAVGQEHSEVSRFERAVDAIAHGDAASLSRLLREEPELVRARSTRAHRGTLLHYVGANGVENYRQKTPKNAVEILRLLLDAGAEVDAVADMYNCDTTLGLVATSIHPRLAGVQIALIDELLAAGAKLDGPPDNKGSIVRAALANGCGDAAAYLASRGFRLELEGAAGVGRLDVVKGYFRDDGSLKATASDQSMRDGYTWACEFGRTDVVEFLLDHGIAADDRLRHHGATGLHWAALGGHPDTVELLLRRGASTIHKDATYDGTPLSWALHGWRDPAPIWPDADHYGTVALLVAAGARVPEGELERDDIRRDPRMLQALTRI